MQVHYISNQRIAETGDTSGVMIEYQVRDVWMPVYAALYILTGSACQKSLPATLKAALSLSLFLSRRRRPPSVLVFSLFMFMARYASLHGTVTIMKRTN